MQTTILILFGFVVGSWALGVLWVGWFLLTNWRREPRVEVAGFGSNVSVDGKPLGDFRDHWSTGSLARRDG